MSTHRLSSRKLQKSFRLPAILVLAWLMIALFFGRSSTAFAATRQAPLSLPPQDVTRAGVSVVRLLVSYTGTADTGGAAANSTILCTGLGVLVSSQLDEAKNQYENWVLTDGSLVNNEKKATCLTSAPDATLNGITVYTSAAYNAQSVVKYTVNASAISAYCLPATSSCVNSPTLFSFSSSTQEPQPFIDLASSQNSGNSAQNPPLVLAKSDATLDGLQTTSEGSTQISTYENLLEGYRTPVTQPQNATTLERGALLVNPTGELVGMYGGGSTTVFSLSSIQSLLNATLPKNPNSATVNPVHDNWKNGMDAYYHQMTDSARVAFQQAYSANKNFQAAQRFLSLTEPTVVAQHVSPPPAASPSSEGFSSAGLTIHGVYVLYWQLGLFVAILIALLLLVVFMIWRMRINKRRRALEAELADAEQRATIEAQRIRQSELDVAQEKEEVSASSAPLPVVLKNGPLGSSTLHCPHCDEVVALNARFCGYCQQQLLPVDGKVQRREPFRPASTASEGSQAPLTTPAVSARSIAEQTTIVPANAIAEQPTVVPGRSIAEQPTVDIASRMGAGNEMPADPEKTVPYTMRLSGQRIGFVVGARSNAGIKRKYKPNEDSLFAAQGVLRSASKSPMFGLLVVADGMGGHANGEDASRLAIQAIASYLLPRIIGQPVQQGDAYASLLVEGAQQANLAVHQNNIEQNGDMGTTITATLIIDGIAYVVNVGDSRTYLFNPALGLRKVTTDHSVVASLVEAGIIKPDDIYTHPKRNQIYRSLGEKPAVEIDSFTVQLQPGDKLLLCSDGLWDMVRDPKIEAVVKNPDPNPFVIGDALIQAALDGGGEDNVSVIVVNVTEPIDTAGMPQFQLIAKPDSVQIPQLQ
ncbi:PP2C family serine/threonine-protein phosphatase [Dictyobacter arantiisoli]|uniref:PPM-type phosphatase domain-containing protein n=1 Tax=Dictyobacter arantiisoli TaxID=2014874 RepID=A0A5A5TG07_9CHLR|nr:protein phosphatase 2C domain-containing protein [Dictyobacter arantiisoli]GCF10188.1 hypothetical protein KDI_37520 [Dictyobacter arantiisoli]